MVAITLGSWGIGGIGIGLLTFLIQDSYNLSLFLAIAFPVGTAANFLIPKTSPRLMYKKGLVTEMMDSLLSISHTNKTKKTSNLEKVSLQSLLKNKLGLVSYDFEKFNYVVKYGKNQNQTKGVGEMILDQLKAFAVLFELQFLGSLVALIVEYCSQFILYNGTTVAVGTLGFDTIQYNGMLLGATSCLGSLLPIPYLGKMPRRLFSQIYLSLIALCGLCLWSLRALFSDWEYSHAAESFLAAGVANILLWLLFCVNYIHVVESFPIKVRGLAFGVIIFTSKIIGSSSGIVTDLSLDLGYNSLFLCCMMSLISLPFTLLLKETLDPKQMKDGRATTDMFTSAIH